MYPVGVPEMTFCGFAAVRVWDIGWRTGCYVDHRTTAVSIQGFDVERHDDGLKIGVRTASASGEILVGDVVKETKTRQQNLLVAPSPRRSGY